MEETSRRKSVVQAVGKFIFRFRIVFIVLLALIVLTIIAVAAEAIITGIQEDKVMAYLEEKNYILDESYLYTIGKRSYSFFSFKDGMASQERWDKYDGAPRGDIDQYFECRAAASLFNPYIAIQIKKDARWSTIILVELTDDGTVTNYRYSDSSNIWKEITIKQIKYERNQYFCKHQFGKWMITDYSSCSKAGEEIRICDKCGYTEEQEIEKAKHSYVDNVCIYCGAEKQPVKAILNANEWYVYSDILYYQNCTIDSATPVGNGMSVTYYPFCRHCKAIHDGLFLWSVVDIGYPITKIYSCNWCGKSTLVKLQVG